MNTFLAIVVKIVTCNMVVKILFVGRYDVEGGPHNKGGPEVCISDTCSQTYVAPVNSQIYLQCRQRIHVLPLKWV